MRVVFVNRYFHPDHSATSQLLTDLALHLAGRGWDVGVVTSRQLYEESRARLPRRERIGGIDVRRIWTSRFGRRLVALRAIDYATFYLSAFRALRREKGAIVVALTDPPLLSIVATLAAPRVVNWIQDLFPEVATALGMHFPPILTRLREWSLRRAAENVVIGELMAQRVGPHAIVLHNWADRDLHPIPRPAGAPFTVAYSGNLGRAHDFETILAAMRNLPEVRFVVTGGGARSAALRAAAPPNAEFRGYVPRERLSENLADADVHLVSLLPGLEGLIVPSKFYGVLAAGRPVVFIGARNGEVARMISEHDCGLVVGAGDARGLSDALSLLARDPERRREMGRRGRALYDARFAPEIAFAHWERILGAVNAAGGADA